MTILPPPPKHTSSPRHKCKPPKNPYKTTRPHSAHGTLWECPACGRWWKYHTYRIFNPQWFPVSWYDIPARRRIAAHKTDNWNAQIHWWECRPNPNRGQP